MGKETNVETALAPYAEKENNPVAQYKWANKNHLPEASGFPKDSPE